MIDGNKPCFEYFITGRKAGPNVTNNQTDRHFVVTTAVDMFQRRWLTFLQAVDRSSMSSLTDVVLDVGEMGPVDTPLVDVRTDTAVTLRHYSGASRERAGPLLVVLLRHFAWLPWRDHISELQRDGVRYESSRIVIIFKRLHRVRWGVNGHCTVLKFCYDALHFHMRSLKINIFKVLFWEGGREGSQKRVLCVRFW